MGHTYRCQIWGQRAGQGEGGLLNVSIFWFILSLKEDITFALVMYACLYLGRVSLRVTVKKRYQFAPRFGTCMYDPYSSTHTIIRVTTFLSNFLSRESRTLSTKHSKNYSKKYIKKCSWKKLLKQVKSDSTKKSSQNVQLKKGLFCLSTQKRTSLLCFAWLGLPVPPWKVSHKCTS